MKIDRAAIKLRPRKNWEAMDLGFVMARHWYWSLWLMWVCVAFPVFSLLLMVFFGDPIIACMVFWWLKPAFEPLLTDWLGQSLFGESLPLRDQLKRLPVAVPKMLLRNLSWGRFSVSRSFNMSVQQLEQLKGNVYRERLNTLQMTVPKSGWLTILCLHLEAALQYSAIALLGLLLPVDWQVAVFSWETLDQEWFDWLSSVIYFMIVSLVAPFYVSAGFSLYINSRTQLEAWDIDVAFRGIVEHRQKSRQPLNRNVGLVALLVFVPILVCLSPHNAQAGSVLEAKAAIEEVLSDKDFGRIEKVEAWRLKFDEPDESKFERNGFDFFWLDSIFKLLGQFLELIAWVAVGGVLVALAINLAPRLGLWEMRWNRKPGVSQPELRSVTLQTGPENLPDNPVEKVLALLQASQHRNSMSVLYRVTLNHYAEKLHLHIPDSASENECLRIITEVRPKREGAYFLKLTRYWQSLAYANQVPSPEVIQELCRGWEQHYAVE